MSSANGAHAANPAGSGLTADVLIIGGGVIGLAIAWRAAQRGLRVTVADPDPGGGASHAAAGMLTPVAEAAYAERHLFGLGSLSLRLYPAFAAELEAERPAHRQVILGAGLQAHRAAPCGQGLASPASRA